MSYIYKLKENANIEKLKELGYQELPETICPAPDNKNYLFKVVLQDTNSDCVLSLIEFYNKMADKICKDKQQRKLHASIGIKFRKKTGKKHYYLMMNKDLRMMFRTWRLEINLKERDIYFTISDGSLPSFYDGELIIEKYCPKEIDELIKNDLVETEELVKETEEVKAENQTEEV